MKKSCLSDKIAATLRQELADGRYGPGRDFPSVDALRQRFGAGEYAVRHALRRLREEGLLIHRQGTGTMPTPKASYAFKGRVAFVSVGRRSDFFRNALSVQLARWFDKAGYDFSTIFIASAADGMLDMEPLRRLAMNGLRFVIVLADQKQVAEACDILSIPYVVLNGYLRDFPNAVAVIREDFRECFAELIRVLRAQGAQTMLEFDFEREMDRGFRRQLSEAGIALSSLRGRNDNSRPHTVAETKRMGHYMVAQFFANPRNRSHPPDVILFDDDYLAIGGLVALFEAGFRIPEDIGVVFYSNKGNEPVLGVEPTRIENDPFSYGDAVAAYVLKLLEGRRAAPPRIRWRFIRGASL